MLSTLSTMTAGFVSERRERTRESRDGDTGEHIERISRLCRSSPDSVLLKPSRLDADEWALMQSHTTIGAAILAGSSSPLLQTALVPELDEEWPTDARGEDPGVGVLTLDQSTAAGATERIHSRNASPPTRA